MSAMLAKVFVAGDKDLASRRVDNPLGIPVAPVVDEPLQRVPSARLTMEVITQPTLKDRLPASRAPLLHALVARYAQNLPRGDLDKPLRGGARRAWLPPLLREVRRLV